MRPTCDFVIHAGGRESDGRAAGAATVIFHFAAAPSPFSYGGSRYFSGDNLRVGFIIARVYRDTFAVLGHLSS